MTDPQNSDHAHDKSEQNDGHEPEQSDQRDNRPDSKDALADEWGEESFPASDPPGAP